MRTSRMPGIQTMPSVLLSPNLVATRLAATHQEIRTFMCNETSSGAIEEEQWESWEC
jgi:hypothetical protein